MLLEEVARHVLCQDVSRVAGAVHLREQDLPGLDLILDPQIGCGQVADFAKSAPPAHADRGCGICPDLERQVDVKILGQGHKANRDRAPLADARELCLLEPTCVKLKYMQLNKLAEN